MGDAQKRADIAASISRMSAYFESREFQEADLTDLETRLDRLCELFKSYVREHLAIVAATISTDEEAVDLNRKVMGDTEDVYLQFKANFVRKIKSITYARPTQADLGGTENDGDADDDEVRSNASSKSHRSFQSISSSVHESPNNLDRLGAASLELQNQFQPNAYGFPFMGPLTGLEFTSQSLPKFNGNDEDWLTLRDSFIRLVHSNDRFYPMAKFNALANHLVGDAASVIRGMTRSNENYPIAWKLVLKEYDRPEKITNSLLTQLTRLKPIPAENLPSLRYVVSKYRMVTRQLEALNHNLRASDYFLVYQLTNLLDASTRRAWELGRLKRDSSTLDDLFDFLDDRIYSLSVALRTTNGRPTTSLNASQPKSSSPRVNQISNLGELCRFCKQGVHLLELCEKFIALNPYPRSQKVKSLKACFNCLSYQHTLDSCTLPPCSHCNTGKKHHKLLCFAYCDEQKKKDKELTVATLSLEPHQFNLQIDDNEGVLLGTAIVLVRASTGEFLPARVLMDNGSQANLISEHCVQRLHLPRSHRSVSVSPVGELSRLETRGIVQLVMIPHNGDDSFQLTVNTLIMKRIASVLPGDHIDLNELPQHVNEQLADPSLHESGPIDILLGANVWSRILMASLHSSKTSNLVAQLTRFGWVVFGGLQTPNTNFVGFAEVHPPQNEELNQLLQRFWHIDELPQLPKSHQRSSEEEMCEEVFTRGFERMSNGRFSVPIPIKPNAANSSWRI